MDKKTFDKMIQEKVMVLDGATGTELQKRGLPKGVCPEKWVLENPDTLIALQKEYIAAGSDTVLACTFGANRIKLKEFELEDKVKEMNAQLVKVSKQAVGNRGYVAGELGPTGQFIEPIGMITFEEMIDIYKEQVAGLLEGGVDYFIIETMMDIQEARAALLAVKESCDLPVCVSMTFNEEGRTLTGTEPGTAVITLQSLGADVVGCNCSSGPHKMLDFIKEMAKNATVPLMAKPNAGLPKLIEGKTVFDMEPEDFASYAKDFVALGVAAIGGCCGSSPVYIEKVAKCVQDIRPAKSKGAKISAVTSVRETTYINKNHSLVIVGERINPTGKKELQQELLDGYTDLVLDYAIEQQEQGAKLLDVNVGMPGIDEKQTMLEVVKQLTTSIGLPLCLDSSSVEVLEEALRIYPGRALINSISAEKVKLERLLPVAAKYGAMMIALPLNDEGVPQTAQDRIACIKNIYNHAKKYGYDKQDIVVDGLVMTVSSDPQAAKETLAVIDWSANEFGVNTIMGLSNVSFGLPQRDWVNAAFLAMAVGRGLTMAIANPESELLMNFKTASDVLMGKTSASNNYIAQFGNQSQQLHKDNPKQNENSQGKQVYEGVLKGDVQGINMLVEKAIKTGIVPKVLVDEYLIPAITQVGELYEQKKYFLPQLIQSGEAMKKAFEQIEPMLKTEDGEQSQQKVKIVLATVKGDIHDIGKNIVALMLKNHGFEVIDLGKDVATQKIIDTAKKEKARFIGLSALMTTTMLEMEQVVKLAKAQDIDSKIIVGGAVVTQEYAKQIGADGYAQDAHSAVKLLQKL